MATQEEFTTKYKEVEEEVVRRIKKALPAILKAVNLEDEENNYYMPKYAISVVLKTVAQFYEPSIMTRKKKQIGNRIYSEICKDGLL